MTPNTIFSFKHSVLNVVYGILLHYEVRYTDTILVDLTFNYLSHSQYLTVSVRRIV